MRARANVSVGELFKRLGETPMTRKARADSVFRRLRETEEDEFLGTFIRAPHKRPAAATKKSADDDNGQG
ncbi:MAG: hypothetical protein HXY21_03890 [Parvularculaceae bacterium]|nr:hypothetical protein [Parvularculaceae bacterium]